MKPFEIILLIILSPILIPVILIVWLFIWLFTKDSHTECENGNHDYRPNDYNVKFSHRCKNCGLLG